MTVLFKILFLLAVGQAISITSEKLFTSQKGKTFYIEQEHKYDWFESYAKCKRMNMSLIAFDSQVKWDDVLAMIKKHFGTKLNSWTSGYAVGEKRQFIWMTTGEEFTSTFWRPGNPDFVQEKEFCVHIEPIGQDIQWNDNTCTKKFGFICEFNEQLCSKSNESAKPNYHIIFNNYQTN